MYIARKRFFDLRFTLAIEPRYWLLYKPFVWREQIKMKMAGYKPEEALVNSCTELVIDGFPGSANSFATDLFKQSQTKSIALAHHLHSSSQIIRAIDLNIPILLTIREPEGAILSLTSRWPYISVSQGLRKYIAFYSKLKPFTSYLVISNFEQTTKHLDFVVDRVNQKFSSNFEIDKNHTNQIEKIRKSSENSRRNDIKRKKREEFNKDINIRLLYEANALYSNFEHQSK